jgi:hypothetical protein
MKRARYRISGESTSTRQHGAEKQAARRFLPGRYFVRVFANRIYLVHGMNVNRNPFWHEQNQ